MYNFRIKLGMCKMSIVAEIFYEDLIICIYLQQSTYSGGKFYFKHA